MAKTHLYSMTGYADQRDEDEHGSWRWEIKSVNSKGLDIRVHLPSGLMALEIEIRKILSRHFKRGSFTVNLRRERTDETDLIQINKRQLNAHRRALLGFRHEQEVSTVKLKGVTETARSAQSDDPAMSSGALLKSFKVASDALTEARLKEGQATKPMLISILKDISDTLKKSASVAENQIDLAKKRLEKRLSDILSDTQLDEQRLAQEVAILAQKGDIREEIDRLDAHIMSGLELLESKGPHGRKLDFLSQELGREINTLCSKSASLELTNLGLELKALNEQFKEQVQNVE